MSTKLRISRLSRIVGWGRYRVVLDGEEVGTLDRGQSVEIEVAPGAHTLQLLSSVGLTSPAATFRIFAGETAAFSCYPPSFLASLPRLIAVLLLQRGTWITLDRATHDPEGDGNPDESEQRRDLIEGIQAGRTNVRW